ncbi:cytochrome oxidase complex assembly protein 1-domain-containing protein [Leucosporidium creatinivorum]|uniref:Cytochrome oxidase complex assembly protein 1-domain-containing protein n=1 Tax=Leucosporidium creatinivorum TaxID=106004 RepID=A0A1Y2G416_9BASI|nr:cytochrome oxidase complex assembly protein 1-domain-containing protein [Leucosporidium creatinivorum]
MLSRYSARLSARPFCRPACPIARYSTAPPPAPAAAPLPSSSSSLPPKYSSPSARQHRYRREAPIPRDLPKVQSSTPILLAVALIATASWGGFLFYATNNERANSSVVRSLAFQLRSSPVVHEFLGDNVKMPPLVGEFKRVKGSINMLAGRIDVQFRVKGSQAGGTAAFTSVRRGKEGRFEVLRWNITRDDGQVLDLRTRDPAELLRADDGGVSTPAAAAAVGRHLV